MLSNDIIDRHGSDTIQIYLHKTSVSLMNISFYDRDPGFFGILTVVAANCRINIEILRFEWRHLNRTEE